MPEHAHLARFCPIGGTLARIVVIFICFFIISVYVGQIVVGYNLGWTAPVITKLQDLQQTPLPDVITEQEASWIGSFVYVGAMVGPYVSGFLSNRKGCKPCLFLGATIIAIAFLILTLASNLAMIYTGRILGGVGIGIIFVINLVYIGEIASTPIRGILLTCTGVFNTMGTLIMFTIGPYVSYSVTGYIGFALSLVFISGILFLPESPLFLALNGEEDKAKENLSYLGRIDDIDKVIAAKQDLLTKTSTKQQWSEIISIKSNRRAFFITLPLFILQQMSGVIAVVLFATTIFELAGSSISPDLATIIIGLAQVCASIIAPIFVETTGRRSLLLVSTASSCISLTVLGTYFYLQLIESPIVDSLGWLPLAALVAFFLLYYMAKRKLTPGKMVLGFGIIPSTFIGEMFTSNVRSTGSTVTITIAWLIGFSLSSSFAAMVAIGAHVPFWVYAGACGVAFIFSLVFVPETKGKSLVEIQEMLSR